MRKNKKDLRTIRELKEILDNAITLEQNKINANPKGTAKRNNRSQYNNIDRYEFQLRVANTIENDLILTNVKDTTYAINSGELCEIAIKHYFDPSATVLLTSSQGQNDLPRYHKSEIKSLSKTTKSNEWKSSKGALVVMQGDNQINEGVYWITRGELRDEFKNLERLDHKRAKEIILFYGIEKEMELGL